MVELREGNRDHVNREMKKSSIKCTEVGADVIVLGCAGTSSVFPNSEDAVNLSCICSGMAGMERLVQQSIIDAGLKPVKVVDGARAGVEILAGLVRLSRSDAL